MTFKKVVAAICAVSVLVLSSVSVSAAGFTPSVLKKDSVSVVKAVDSDGNDVKIIVTPISKPSDAPTKACADQLEKAYQEIKAASSLDKLNYTGENPFEANTTDVVANLFDVYATDNSVFEGGKTVTVTFKVSDLNTDVDSTWIHRNSESEKWNGMDMTKEGTNTYTTTFSSLSPVAIAVPSSTSTSPSPQTGDTTPYTLYIITITGIIALAGVAAFAGIKFVKAK